MKEREDIWEKNEKFIEEMYDLEMYEIDRLETIVLWIFEAADDPEKKYFFVKNWLYGSNYAEKIASRLKGLYNFVEEIDTEERVEHNENGDLTSESWWKIFNKTQELKEIYTGEFFD